MKSILTLVFAFSTLLASAQLPINFGPKLGVNYSILSLSEDDFDKQADANISGGAFFRVKIKKFSINAEGLISGVSAQVTPEFQGAQQPDAELDVNFTNLDVPIYFGYKVLDLKVLKLRANLGGMQSFVLGEYSDLEGKNMADGYFSGMVGISADIPLLVFSARYVHGFGNFYEDEDIDFNINNNMLMFTVGWKIL